MGYSYDITTSKKDNKALIGMYACHTIHTIIELFVSTFLIAYIYKFSSGLFDYVIKACTFELLSYSVMMLVYYISSFIVDRTNRIGVYRFSLCCWAVFVVFAVFYGENIAQYIWLAGLFCGIARGTYWSSFNVLKQEMVSRKSMKSFAALASIFQNFISILFPITLGALIEVSTYSQTAVYVLIVCVIQILISFLIKAKCPENSNFNVSKYIQDLKKDKQIYKRFMSLYTMAFVYSSATILNSLSNICIMLQYGSTMSFGFVSGLLAFLSIVFLSIMNKCVKEGKFTWRYYIFSIIHTVGVIIYVLFPSKPTVIVVNCLIAIGSLPCDFYIDVYRNRFLKEHDMYDDIAEHQFLFEFLLNAGRILSFGLIVFACLINKTYVFYILLLCFNALMLVSGCVMCKFEKFYIENDAKEEIEQAQDEKKRN